MRMPDGSEVDGPTSVSEPRFDKRVRAQASDLAELSAKAGIKITVDETLSNGVEVHATMEAGFAGYVVEETRIVVGKHALLADVAAHVDLIPQMKRYNSLLARIKALVSRMFGKGDGKPRYAPGTRGHFSEIELAKLQGRISQRHHERSSGLIDEQTLREEVRFLDGEVALHHEVLTGMIEVGDLHGVADGIIADPDIGKSTALARSAGYKLPGEEGSGVAGTPEHYYYRRTRANAEHFELAIKPSAPTEAPTYRARVLNDKFIGLEDAAIKVPKEVVPVEHSAAQVVARLRETEGFGPYAEMLQAEGLASREVIDAAVARLRGLKNQKGDEVTLDWLRHEVKELFRERLLEKLVGGDLDNNASFLQARRIVDGLGPADRGNLMEVWYRVRVRKAPAESAHVGYKVKRTSGDNAGKIEARVADLVLDRELTEIKDIEGKIDLNQFEAAVDMIKENAERGEEGMSKLRYVFTKEAGAMANLEFFAEAYGKFELNGHLTIEVFDANGKSHTASNENEVMTLPARMRGK
jgi:hypothetical protein